MLFITENFTPQARTLVHRCETIREMVSSNALMASLKALLVSAGAVSIAAVALWAGVPSISGPLGPRLLPALGWFLSCFRPPPPFVVVVVVIAAIAATSRCFRRAQPERLGFAVTVVEEMEVMEATPAAAAEEAFDEFKDFEEKRVVVVEAAAAGNGGVPDGGDGYNGDCEGESKVAFRRSASVRRRRVDPSEKAPVPRRHARRKAAGGDPLQGIGGKALTRSNENMEHVLKAITEAEAERIGIAVVEEMEVMEATPSTAEEEAFDDSKDFDVDLNRRAEAFINKIKEGMRL